MEKQMLFSETVKGESRTFFFDLKENPRGRFLKITEDVGGRRDTVIIPSTGLQSFRDAIEKAIDADEALGAPEIEPEMMVVA